MYKLVHVCDGHSKILSHHSDAVSAESQFQSICDSMYSLGYCSKIADDQSLAMNSGIIKSYFFIKPITGEKVKLVLVQD